MTSDKVREAVGAEPFRPFRLHLGGGRSLDVWHPEFVMISPSGRAAAIYGEDDGLEIIDVFMVQSIEFLTQRARPSRRRMVVTDPGHRARVLGRRPAGVFEQHAERPPVVGLGFALNSRACHRSPAPRYDQNAHTSTLEYPTPKTQDPRPKTQDPRP